MAIPASPSSGINHARASKYGKNAFFFIIVTVFIDMMAFAVIMPSLPYLIAELLHGRDAVVAAKAANLAGEPAVLQAMIADATPWGGYITTVYAIINFLAQPILGNLSDRFGRRPVLLVSLAMLSIDFIIMGAAHSIWLLFLGRFLSGISAATHSTAAAYIADVTEPQQRGQAFGMLGAAFGLGFILGPAIGGVLGDIDPRFPFFASAGLAAINFLYGAFVLPESLDQEHRRKFDWKRANALGAFKHFAKVPYLAWFMLALGLFNFSHWVYPATFNYYAAVNFDWTPNMIGVALAVVGVGSAVVQGAFVGPAIKKFGPTRTVTFGFIICIVTFAAYAFVTQGWMVFIIIPIGALAGVLGPSLNQIMTSRAPKNAQGELQGAIGSVQALSNVFAPLAMTQTFYFFTHKGAPFYFPGAAFALASLVCAISMIPLMRGLKTVPKIEDQPADPAGEAVAPPEGQMDGKTDGKTPDAAPQTA